MQIAYHLRPDASVIGVSDATGALLYGENYSAYGDFTNGFFIYNSGATPGPMSLGPQFQGQWQDGTGNYMMGARAYSPTLGRFLSTDPIGLGGGTNLYAFTGDRPLTMSDPSGMDPPDQRPCPECCPGCTVTTNNWHHGGDETLGGDGGVANALNQAAAYGRMWSGMFMGFAHAIGYGDGPPSAGPISAAGPGVQSPAARMRISLPVMDPVTGILRALKMLHTGLEALGVKSDDIDGANAALQSMGPLGSLAGDVLEEVEEVEEIQVVAAKGGVYVPGKDGEYIPLSQQVVNNIDIPLPDPRAAGAPHTVLGGRMGSDGVLYRQSATFPGDTWPTANGYDVPWSRVDWTNHGRSDHTDPHMQTFIYDSRPNKGGWIEGPQLPFQP
jgi:RHS repeat-associated protein